MSLLLIQLLAATFSAIIPIWTGKKYFPSSVYIAPILTVIIAVLVAHLIGRFAYAQAKPNLDVQILHQREGEVLIKVNKGNKILSSLEIEVPIMGKIINIHSNDRASSEIDKKVVGTQGKYSVNIARIVASNISQSVENFEYKILFEPISEQDQKSIMARVRELPAAIPQKALFNLSATNLRDLLWSDWYMVRHSWLFDGNVQQKEFYKSQNNIMLGGQYPYRFRAEGFNFEPRARSEEEARDSYQQGLKIWDFNNEMQSAFKE